ncbi:Chaperone DnaJ-domain superfamily protein [Raphanus sativus]|nr:Chaperone DnaJ-domain superfamily protein [Raphanus sativus]
MMSPATPSDSRRHTSFLSQRVKSRNGSSARFPSRATSFRAYTQTLNAEPAVAESVRRRVSSLYELLKVNETASVTEIKTAYRSLAKVYHPDASESDGQDFMEIHRAYATLADQTTRAIYDSTHGSGGSGVHDDTEMGDGSVLVI